MKASFFHRVLVFASASALLIGCDLIGVDPEDDNNSGENKGSVDIRWINSAREFDLSCNYDTVQAVFAVWEGEKYDLEWTAETSDSWIKVAPSSGKSSCEIMITVDPNETASDRSGSVTIKCKDSRSSLKINQSLFGGAMQDESWFDTNYWERTDREKAGLRGPVESWYEDHYTTFHKYFYDTAGHLIKDEYHNLSDSTVSVDWEYEYDEQGHLTKAVSGERNMTFTYEYDNTGKFVATDPYIWVPIYVSGKNYPLTIFKDLSALHYEDNTAAIYFESEDISYVFDEDGNLTIISQYQRGIEGDVICDTSKVIYENGLPVSSEKGGVAVTYASNGMPLTLSRDNGKITFRFLENDKELLIQRMDEPNAGGMVAKFWGECQYNRNGDMTQDQHAYFSTDQIYLDTYDKYYYDSYGNWIRRTETIEPAFQHGEHFPSAVDRVIEYYK